MRTLAFAVAAVAALPASLAYAAPITWDIDSAHSVASFSVKHMMVATVRGEFGRLTGTIVTEGSDWKTAKVEAGIDATTVNTREPKRDNHLKSPDFFDVAKFPTLTFKSTKVEAAGGTYKLTGDLTIRGITKSITFDVQAPSQEWKSLSGKQVVGTSATAKVNRKDFGLNWNKPLDKAGGMLVGDEVTITLDLELTKR